MRRLLAILLTLGLANLVSVAQYSAKPIVSEIPFTQDHDDEAGEVNRNLSPFHAVLQRMKLKADSLIISTYSQEFFDKHVRFEFECYAYHQYRTKLATSEDSVWTSKYLGSWTDPIKSRPNSFKFRYQVRLHPSDEEGVELGMDLDSLGNYVPSADDFWNNYGFENVAGERKEFLIDIDKATSIAKQHGLMVSDTCRISALLIWENFKNQSFFNGQYRYYIIKLTSETEYKKGKERQGVVFRYDVYSFNPWTGVFVEKKKMKAVHEWGKSSGHRTGLLPDTE